MKFSYPLILTGLFFTCFVFSLLINYILLKFAQTLGIRGKEAAQVRWNPNSKPALGGISFFVIFLFAFVFSNIISEKSEGYNLSVIGILIASTLAFLMGLADDAFNTNPLLKFLTQVICAFTLIVTGHYITIFQNEFLNYIFTVFWVVGMMNSINMLDNMDGITSLVSINICFFVVMINVSQRNTTGYETILSLSVLGAIAGFLVYNFHPSKMFMGDTGSQFIGLFLSVMGIDYCWDAKTTEVFSMPYATNFLIVMLVFLLPITDTLTVVINRLREGRSPFVGGKDHTTHHLFFKGITEKRIAILYSVIGLLSAILAYNLILNFSYMLFYLSIAFSLLISIGLYLNTVIRKK